MQKMIQMIRDQKKKMQMARIRKMKNNRRKASLYNKLSKISNNLDLLGHYDLADEIDGIIRLASNEPPCNCDVVNLIGTGHEPDCEYMAWKAAGKPEYKPADEAAAIPLEAFRVGDRVTLSYRAWVRSAVVTDIDEENDTIKLTIEGMTVTMSSKEISDAILAAEEFRTTNEIEYIINHIYSLLRKHCKSAHYLRVQSYQNVVSCALVFDDTKEFTDAIMALKSSHIFKIDGKFCKYLFNVDGTNVKLKTDPLLKERKLYIDAIVDKSPNQDDVMRKLEYEMHVNFGSL
jgi:hypothetical protein